REKRNDNTWRVCPALGFLIDLSKSSKLSKRRVFDALKPRCRSKRRPVCGEGTSVPLTNDCESPRRSAPAWLVGTNGKRLIRFGSLFLTLPTRALTGQHVIASEGYS